MSTRGTESVDTSGAWSEDYVTWGYASDLSGERVGYQVLNLAKQEGTCIEQATDYRRIDLDRSNLAGAQFQFPIQLPISEQVKGFNFSRREVQIVLIFRVRT